jgi:hypothetical protein
MAAARSCRAAGACQVELIPIIAAVALVVARAIGPITDLIRQERRLRLCRYLYDDAVARGEKPDAVEIIRAISEGGPGRSTKRPALPSPPKSDDTSLAA